MNTLTQLFLFSAVVAVALCGAAPRAEDVAIMKDTAEAILKLHKLHKAGVVGEDVVENLCSRGASYLTICQQLNIPVVGSACSAAQTTCKYYTPVKNLISSLGHSLSSLFG